MIRRYKERDFERFKDIVRGCFDQYVYIGAGELEEKMKAAIVDDFTSNAWNDRLINEFETYVCDSEIGVMGSGALLKHDNGPEIDMLFIEPDYHRLGIGTKMMGFLESLAKDRGYHEVFLHSYLNGIKFYENRGYKAVR